MNVILWLEELQPPLMNQAINAVAREHGALEFVGAIPSEKMPIGNGRGAAFLMNGKPIPVLVDRKSVAALDYDIVIVGGNNVVMPDILKRAKRLNVDEEKIVLDRTTCVPGFTLEKYQRLRRSNLTILSQNCWGGFVYHLFGLPFLSPIVNMFMSEFDFLKFLRDPRHYISQKLRLVRTQFNPELKINYPIFAADDITLNMNHYADFDVARAKWRERCRRINWDNILAVMYTDAPKVLDEFNKTTTYRKVCFTNFQTDLDCGFYIEPRFTQGLELWQPVNLIAQNLIACFDLWDLLLDGKKTPLEEGR